MPRATFYRWVNDGTILSTRVMHSLRISTPALARFLALRTENAAADLRELPPHERLQAEEHNRAILQSLQAEIARENAAALDEMADLLEAREEQPPENETRPV